MAQPLRHTVTTPPAPRAATNGLIGQLWPAISLTLVLAVLCGIIYPLVVWGVAQLAFPHQANGSLVDKDGKATTHDDAAVGSRLIGQSFGDGKYFHPRPSNAGAGYDASNTGATNYGPLSDELLNGLLTPAASQPATQPADTQVATQVAASQPSSQPAALPTLTFDGVRLRTLHYARDNNISFKLCKVQFKADGTTVKVTTEVPLATYLDKDGNINDLALVDAFPHASDAANRAALIAYDFATPIPADAVTASASGLDPHISPANAQLQSHRVAQARQMTDAELANYVSRYTDQPSLGILGDPGVNVLLLNLALDREHPVVVAAATVPATTATSRP